ncbi:MAG: thiamine pyrophosphate-binding protein [Leucobacter sp.]
MSAPTLANILALSLARHTKRAFGLMGNGNAHLIDQLSEAGIVHTEMRHEAGTVAAADAYTRVSGEIAIATTTYGAGFTNCLTALAEAAQARTPLIVAVGDAPSTGPRPWDVDQETLAAGLGVRTYRLATTDIANTVDHAVDYAHRARRPIVLAIPYDLAAAVTGPDEAEATGPLSSTEGIDLDDPAVRTALIAAVLDSPARQTSGIVDRGRRQAPMAPDLQQVRAAAQTLAAARRPLILAGHGAHLSGAGQQLGALADRLGALTATTALARSIFPEPRFDLGVTGGFGQELAMAKIAQADAVVVVGASLNQFTMRFGELFGAGTSVIRIDVDHVPAPRSAHPVTYRLLRGDAAATLTALLTELSGTVPSLWREDVTGLEPNGALRWRDTGLTSHPDGICADGRLDPRAVASELAHRLPSDRHVTTDGGHFIGWANTRWEVSSPERMIMVGTAYQTIGLGFATVAGVATAAPGSTVVLSTGDGGGLMGLADLETAIRTAASCVIVVWNDGAYGAEVHLYGTMGLRQNPMLIPEVDFAGLATALGATGIRVERLEDLTALDDWQAAGAHGTLLLDCKISRSVVAEYQREIQRVNGLDPH